MVKFTMLNAAQLRSMLFWEDFAIVDWLDRSVIMILVNFSVHGSVDLFMLVRLDGFFLNTRCHGLVNRCVMMTGVANEFADCCLGLIHCDCGVC